MSTFVNWAVHHVMLLLTLLSAATLMGLLVGTAFYMGGTTWEHALQISRYLASTLVLPSGMIWATNVYRDLRHVIR